MGREFFHNLTVLGLAMWRVFSTEVHKSYKCLFLHKCSLKFRQPPYCQTDVVGSAFMVCMVSLFRCLYSIRK
jgi:hypothetical protein